MLWHLVMQLNSKLKTQNSKFRSAIVPVIIGDENKAVEAAAKLRAQNIFIPAIRYPTVARGAGASARDFVRRAHGG